MQLVDLVVEPLGAQARLVRTARDSLESVLVFAEFHSVCTFLQLSVVAASFRR